MIITNKLNFKFLKTIKKPACLNSISAKIKSFKFINTIIKSLKLGLKIIFLDESFKLIISKSGGKRLFTLF